MDFEDILWEVGDSGKYQKELILFFLLPYVTLIPWFSTNLLLMVSVPDHWCNVPEVVASNLTTEQQRQLISPPADPKCFMYDINYTNYLTSGIYSVPNNTTTRSCNNGWEYDRTYHESTIATQWNMFCEDGHYTSFVLTLYSVGSIIGTPIYVTLSDRIGRKITFFICLTVTSISAFASVLMTNFTAFVVIKAINGSLMPSVFQLPFIIVLELIAPKSRTHMNGLANGFWCFGLCWLPLIAYLTRSWIRLGLVTSSVTLLFFSYWKYLPESPRWLLSQERYDEAAAIMQKIGDKNGKSPNPDKLLAKLKKLGERTKNEKEVNNSSIDLLKYPQLKKSFIIITLCWTASVLSYYGLQLNVSNLMGNEFLNFFLTAVVEIPGYGTSWLLMNKFGRRWVSTALLLMTGLVCMLSAVISGLPYSDVICSMLGKYFCAAAFMTTYQQSSELYPTVMRSSGMGMSSTISNMASLVVPYIIYLAVYDKAIPFILIGSVCIIAGVAASFLPETLNVNLPQTISDAEELGRHHKYFSWISRRRSISSEKEALLILQKDPFENEAMTDEERDETDKLMPLHLQDNDILQNRKKAAILNVSEKRKDESAFIAMKTIKNFSL